MFSAGVCQFSQSPWSTQRRNPCLSSEAANVEANRAHGHGARFGIGKEDRADWHAIPVVDVGRDRDQFDTSKAGGIDDLGIDGVLDLVEQVRREEEPHRSDPDLLGMECVVASTGIFKG